MPDMGISHQQRVAAHPCNAAAFRRAAIDRHIFTHHIIAADFELRLFAFKAQVLWLSADCTERKEAVVCANFRRPVDRHMRHQLAPLAQLNAGAGHAERPNRTRVSHLRGGINDGCRMDHSVSVGGSAGAFAAIFPRFMETSCALTVPSQTSFPFTKALPSIRTI